MGSSQNLVLGEYQWILVVSTRRSRTLAQLHSVALQRGAPLRRCAAVPRSDAAAARSGALCAGSGAAARRFRGRAALAWLCIVGLASSTPLILGLTRACAPQIGSFAAFLFGFGAFPRSRSARARGHAFPVLLEELFLRYL